MIVNYADAQRFYDHLEHEFKYPSINPTMIEIEAKLRKLSKPLYFLINDSQEFFFYASILNPVQDTHYFDLETPISYGGPITNIKNKSRINEIKLIFREICIRESILVEFIRFIPLLKNNIYYSGNVVFNRSTVVVDTGNPNYLNNYSKNLTRSIKKNNAIEIKVSKNFNDIELFFEIYRKNMEAKKARIELFTNIEFLRDVIMQKNSVFYVATLNSQIIAGAIFLNSEYYSEYFLSAMDMDFNKLEPLKLILHTAISTFKKIGIKSVHLGGGTSNEEDDPLLFSKTRFSKKKCDFFIGWTVFLEKEYEYLKQKHTLSKKQNPIKVIFYNE